MEGNNTYLDPPDVRFSLPPQSSPFPRQARRGRELIRLYVMENAQATNVTSGRITEKETKSFAFDKSYWSVSSLPSQLQLTDPN